jgi:hypothetical protein
MTSSHSTTIARGAAEGSADGLKYASAESTRSNTLIWYVESS